MFEHKYIRLFETLELWEEARDNREFTEVNVAAVIGDREETPDNYLYSIRTTNNDNERLGPYNSNDDINYYGGLEIIWGYWGWVWEDYEYNGEILKGGHMIQLKTTSTYPPIYDGYRLQHINDLTAGISTSSTSNLKIGHFDNSNVLSANNSFKPYAYIDKDNNTWNVESAVNMFYSSSTNFHWSGDGVITDLYFTKPLFKSGPIFSNLYSDYPKLHFHSIEKLNIGRLTSTIKYYIGNPPEDNSEEYIPLVNTDALRTCYDYSLVVFNNSGGKYLLYLDVNYTGNETVILPNYSEINTIQPKNFTIRCHKPWCINNNSKDEASLMYYLDSKNHKMDIDEETLNNYDYTLYKPGHFIYRRCTLYFNNSTYNIPEYVFKKYPINIFSYCTLYNHPLTYNAFREGLNIPTDEFREFYVCNISGASEELHFLITNLKYYDNLTLTFYNGTAGGNYIDLYLSDDIDTPSTYKTIYYSRPYNIKDSHIILVGDDSESNIMNVDLQGNYENSKICLAPNSSKEYVKIKNYGNCGTGSPEVYSNEPIMLDSNWIDLDMIDTDCEEIHLKDLLVAFYTGSESNALTYIYVYLTYFEKLRIVEMPTFKYRSWWRLDRALNLDIPSLIDSLNRQTSSVIGLTINRVVYDKLTPELLSIVRSKGGLLSIYENEV